LSRRIESTQRLDHVANEFQPHWLGVAGGKHINDAAADCERAVLINGVSPCEPCINEEIRQCLRIDFRAGMQFEGRTEKTVR
jgi:hypothetical protein